MVWSKRHGLMVVGSTSLNLFRDIAVINVIVITYWSLMTKIAEMVQ
jgi:hypothetical protein